MFDFFRPKILRCSEVALEQFWIQKSFCPAFNIRLGHIIMPMGGTNQHHMPTEFFGVYRPEGENTILPCTWHETSISFWGEHNKWRYEVMLLPWFRRPLFFHLFTIIAFFCVLFTYFGVNFVLGGLHGYA